MNERMTKFVVLFIASASLLVFAEHPYNKREREALNGLNNIINQREVKRIKRKFKSK